MCSPSYAVAVARVEESLGVGLELGHSVLSRLLRIS